MFLDHTQRRRQDSSGRVISSSQRPLPDNTQHSQQKNIHAPVGFEPKISAGERPQTCALDRAATGSYKSITISLEASTGPQVSRRFRLREFVGSRHMKVVRLSAPCTGRSTPGDSPGTHFHYRLSRLQNHSRSGRIMSMKNSNDSIGNRNRFQGSASTNCPAAYL